MSISIILISVYIVCLLLAAAYAGIIAYHVIKYQIDDLPRAQEKYAQSILWLYLTFGIVIIVGSIVMAIILFMQNSISG